MTIALIFFAPNMPPLPEPIAFAAGLDCTACGFLDVMAWNEGEFTLPLFTADQIFAYGNARAAAAVLAERERCAKLCESEHVGESVNDDRLVSGDMAYNTALRHAAAAIRAEPPKEQQP